jgi:hypothetical protein
MRTRRKRAIGKEVKRRNVQDRPIWIEPTCWDCGELLTIETEGWALGYKDEWECPNCMNGIYLDEHPNSINRMKKDLQKTRSNLYIYKVR